MQGSINHPKLPPEQQAIRAKCRNPMDIESMSKDRTEKLIARKLRGEK
jgi:hypothetical protein